MAIIVEALERSGPNRLALLIGALRRTLELVGAAGAFEFVAELPRDRA